MQSDDSSDDELIHQMRARPNPRNEGTYAPRTKIVLLTVDQGMSFADIRVLPDGYTGFIVRLYLVIHGRHYSHPSLSFYSAGIKNYNYKCWY